MVFGGLICILLAIWIYRTAIKEKTGNAFYWVVGCFVIYLAGVFLMTYFNGFIIEIFDTDISSEYDNAGGLNARDNSDTAGLQTGTGGTLIGITFELLTWFAPVLFIALLRQLVMLKQAFSLATLFSGVKEMFVSIINSFKTT
jgi:hypothetical protein